MGKLWIKRQFSNGLVLLRASKHGVPASNLSRTISRPLGFLVSPSWYFYLAFLGKQEIDLVPVDHNSGAMWDKWARVSFEKLMKATGFLL